MTLYGLVFNSITKKVDANQCIRYWPEEKAAITTMDIVIKLTIYINTDLTEISEI